MRLNLPPLFVTQPKQVPPHLLSSESYTERINNRFSQQHFYWVPTLTSKPRPPAGLFPCSCVLRSRGWSHLHWSRAQRPAANPARFSRRSGCPAPGLLLSRQWLGDKG